VTGAGWKFQRRPARTLREDFWEGKGKKNEPNFFPFLSFFFRETGLFKDLWAKEGQRMISRHRFLSA
jgi:hypothetical protein